MCAVSNVGDFYTQRWQGGIGSGQIQIGQGQSQTLTPLVSKQEFDALKQEVAEMKRLLLMAKEIDEKTNQTDCEHPDKIRVLQEVAKLVGVDLSDVFGKKA
jgi:hypothetical protein